MNKRNGTIDFWRFCFSVMIVIYHALFSAFRGGYIAVDFFFLVSGYMLAQSYEKRNHDNTIGRDTIEFMKHKVSGLLPNVYIAFGIGFIVVHYNQSISDIIDWFIHDFYIFFLCNMSGLGDETVNGVVWYLSAMLISTLIIYPFMRKYHDNDVFYCVIAPLGFLFGLGFLAQNMRTLNVSMEWNGWVRLGLIRAIAEILGGCIIYRVSKVLQTIQFTKIMKWIFTFMEWGTYIFVIAFAFNHRELFADYFLLILLMIGITLSTSRVGYGRKIDDSKLIRWLGEFSFSLYLGHDFWKQFLTARCIGWSEKNILLLYLLLAFLTALFIMYISKYLKAIWKKRWTKIIVK